MTSFFINDGILFPDLIHAVKAEADKGFPTGWYPSSLLVPPYSITAHTL